MKAICVALKLVRLRRIAQLSGVLYMAGTLVIARPASIDHCCLQQDSRPSELRITDESLVGRDANLQAVQVQHRMRGTSLVCIRRTISVLWCVHSLAV